MSLSLYMDHHVPAAITRGLRKRGVDVITAYEDGRARTSDEELLDRATELGRILVTRDEDFLSIANKWNTANRHFPGIAYLVQITIGRIVNDLHLIVEASKPEELAEQIIYLPL